MRGVLVALLLAVPCWVLLFGFAQAVAWLVQR